MSSTLDELLFDDDDYATEADKMVDKDKLQNEPTGHCEDDAGDASPVPAAHSRRGFLKSLGGAGALSATGSSLGLGAGLFLPAGEAHARPPNSRQKRSKRVFQVRKRAAHIHLKEVSSQH